MSLDFDDDVIIWNDFWKNRFKVFSKSLFSIFKLIVGAVVPRKDAKNREIK